MGSTEGAKRVDEVGLFLRVEGRCIICTTLLGQEEGIADPRSLLTASLLTFH